MALRELDVMKGEFKINGQPAMGGSIGHGWDIMQRSVMALFLRELKTRFGKYQLGYAWALLEPVATTAIVLMIFRALGSSSPYGIPFMVFLGSGILLNSLFVEITNRSIKAMEANSTLFNYRPIKPIDTVVARCIVEWMLHIGVYATLLAFFLMFNQEKLEIEEINMPLLLAIFLLVQLFAFGVGVLFMLITDLYGEADKVLPILTRPLFFISGIMFTSEHIPEEYWPLLYWNPIYNAVELSRQAVAPHYHHDPQVSLGYLALVAVTVTTVSLMFYRKREIRMRLR